jgi:hypothetical protein
LPEKQISRSKGGKSMRVFSIVPGAICVLLSTAMLSAAAIEFDGETYVKKDSGDTPEVRRVEYVRDDETLDNWTKLIGIRNFTNLESPKEAVSELEKTLKENDPDSDPFMLASPDGSDAMISFVVGPEDNSYGELNIWRYTKVDGYPGLIAYQFAYRFQGTTDEEVAQFQKDIKRWIQEMSEADFELEFDE